MTTVSRTIFVLAILILLEAIPGYSESPLCGSGEWASDLQSFDDHQHELQPNPIIDRRLVVQSSPAAPHVDSSFTPERPWDTWRRLTAEREHGLFGYCPLIRDPQLWNSNFYRRLDQIFLFAVNLSVFALLYFGHRRQSARLLMVFGGIYLPGITLYAFDNAFWASTFEGHYGGTTELSSIVLYTLAMLFCPIPAVLAVESVRLRKGIFRLGILLLGLLPFLRLIYVSILDPRTHPVDQLRTIQFVLIFLPIPLIVLTSTSLVSELVKDNQMRRLTSRIAMYLVMLVYVAVPSEFSVPFVLLRGMVQSYCTPYRPRCVLSGTAIAVPEGEKRVEDLLPDTTILSVDSSNTLVSDLVVGLRQSTAPNYLTIRTNHGEELRLTAPHPVYTSRGWVAACRIQVGDTVRIRQAPFVATVASIELHHESAEVYELMTKSQHNFMAGGIMIHNVKP